MGIAELDTPYFGSLLADYFKAEMLKEALSSEADICTELLHAPLSGLRFNIFD